MYVQEEGAPMGGPLSGLLADLIIENKIEKQIATHPRWGKLVDWIRKADDTFLEWTGTLHDLNDFHTFLNSLHPTIKWTMELEKDNQIPFLDVLIIKSPPELLTTVYRKCSASNRYIHFTSSQVWSEKTAALKTLRRRAEDYCSTPHLLQEELQLLTQIFLQNGFPAQTIHRILHKETPSTHPHTNPDEHPEETHKPSSTFFAPFHPSATRLFKTLRTKFNISTIHTKTTTLGNILLKRRPNQPLHSPGVVYAIPCECSKFYIGETKRTAAIRISEEAAACAKVDRTNKLSTNQQADLGITTHHKLTGHTFNFNSTKIISSESNWYKRKLLEGLYIQTNKEHAVNLKAGAKLDNCWTPTINKTPGLKISW
jgi:hypothetical protein